jgi:methylated-DNA-[protein]-cysteine S-methyltransferase
MFQAVLEAPFGALGLRCDDERVIELNYLPHGFKALAARTPLAREVVRQVRAYLKDPEFVFDLPLTPVGSAFQQRVWKAISNIPAGEVRSYGAVARTVASAPRAVGQACGANWYPLVIPCHRVIASGGIGGFGGTAAIDGDQYQLRIKRWLLAHEGAKDQRLNG